VLQLSTASLERPYNTDATGNAIDATASQNSKCVTKLEEEVIIQRILDDSLRGIPPLKANVRDIADRLLGERASKPTGKNQVDGFIKRTPKLRTR
jgi:hypothetical protein